MENNNIEQRVQDKIAKGITYNFDKFFSDGWRIWKKTTLLIAGAIFLVAIPLVIIFFISILFLFGIYSIRDLQYIVTNPEAMETMENSLLFILKATVFSFLITILLAPLGGGFLKLCRDADKTGDVSFGTIFSGYKGRYFIRLVGSALVIAFISNTLSLVCGMLGPFGSLLRFITSIGIYTMAAFVQPLIVFGGASIGQSLKLSVSLAGKKFFLILGYFLLFGLMYLAGAFVCGIGAFFTVAFLPICSYMLYKQTLGFPEDEIEAEQSGNWQQEQPPTV